MGLKEMLEGLMKKQEDLREKVKPVAHKVKRWGARYGLYDPDQHASLRVPRNTFYQPDPLFGDMRWWKHKRGRPPGKKRKKRRRSWGSRAD